MKKILWKNLMMGTCVLTSLVAADVSMLTPNAHAQTEVLRSFTQEIANFRPGAANSNGNFQYAISYGQVNNLLNSLKLSAESLQGNPVRLHNEESGNQWAVSYENGAGLFARLTYQSNNPWRYERTSSTTETLLHDTRNNTFNYKSLDLTISSSSGWYYYDLHINSYGQIISWIVNYYPYSM
jgi:hypothetical protein